MNQEALTQKCHDEVCQANFTLWQSCADDLAERRLLPLSGKGNERYLGVELAELAAQACEATVQGALLKDAQETSTVRPWKDLVVAVLARHIRTVRVDAAKAKVLLFDSLAGLCPRLYQYAAALVVEQDLHQWRKPSARYGKEELHLLLEASQKLMTQGVHQIYGAESRIQL